MPDHHVQAFQPRQLAGHRFDGIITGGNERGTQQQVFGGIAADGQLGGEDEAGTLGVGAARGVDDLLRIARHVAHHEVELGDADVKGHFSSEKRPGRLCHPGPLPRRPRCRPKPGTSCSQSRTRRRHSCGTSTCPPCTTAAARSRRPAGSRSFVTLWRGEAMLGACALYRKGHSYGEYVFDWAWANAYEQNGLALLPQGIGGGAVHAGAGSAPAGRDDAARHVLAQGLLEFCKQQELSSCTCCSSPTPTCGPAMPRDSWRATPSSSIG
jgi:hypothetical protein